MASVESFTSMPGITSLFVFPTLSCIIYVLALKIHLAFFTQLAAFPGPRMNTLTKLPHLYQIWVGNEARYIEQLHATYGPVVRVAPRELSFTQGAPALQAIYGVSKSGLHGLKDLRWYVEPINHVPNVRIQPLAGLKNFELIEHSLLSRTMLRTPASVKSFRIPSAQVRYEGISRCFASGLGFWKRRLRKARTESPRRIW